MAAFSFFGGQTDESGRLAEKAELIIPGEPTLGTG